ncbi:hypothetical protein [Pseudomonas sp. AFG_SD02_1510_Pfu_092]|nr:hypothetical protein [Pseudomonas sp. AFG_SD02_1510_Pfu_092]
MAANTGTAGAIHRVAYFAGMPAPTGLARSRSLVAFVEAASMLQQQARDA